MILITGNGALAQELLKYSTKEIPIISLSKREMDITNEEQVSNVIKKHMMLPNFPKYIIHTAALTKPMSVNDKNPIMSIDANIIGTANVAKICHKYDIKFIYISTDFVYDSRTKHKVDEESSLKPINNYGWSKLGGECVTQLIPESLILRCSLCDIPFRHKAAFDNIYRTSIRHKDAAKLILKVKDQQGIINIGGPEQTVYNFVKEYQDINPTTYKGNSSQVTSIKLNINKLKNINE
jgi:dTDP-4-dehydrorhamnose reductase